MLYHLHPCNFIKDIYEEVVAKYNDEDLEPVSRPVPNFHTKLTKAMSLEKISDDITAVQAKDKFISAMSCLRRARANWKQSGNGSGNRLAQQQ